MPLAECQHAYDPVGDAKWKPNTEMIRNRATAILQQLFDKYGHEVPEQKDHEALRASIRQMVNGDIAPLTMMEKGILLQTIFDEFFGFGPLGPLLRDPSVNSVYCLGIG